MQGIASRTPCNLLWTVTNCPDLCLNSTDMLFRSSMLPEHGNRMKLPGYVPLASGWPRSVVYQR